MIFESQRDPRWRDIKLGKSNLSIGDYGCTTTCISMLSDYFKCFKSPAELAQGIQGYTPDGLIDWPTLKLPMKWDKRLRVYDQDAIMASIKDPKKAVILELQLTGTKHWVVALSKIPLTNSYWIVDPWDSTKKTTMAYKNAIIGSSHYFIN